MMKCDIQKLCTNHGGLLNDRVVSLLQVAVQDITKHTGGILMQVASSFGHAVVLAPDRDVDALFLLGDVHKTQTTRALQTVLNLLTY